MLSVTSKTSALQSLLLRAWRERWNDIEWSIHLKSVLPRGCSGDAYNLSNLILQQALIGPIPNMLILSYLKHSLAAQTVSYAALLEAIYCFSPEGSPPTKSSSFDDSLQPAEKSEETPNTRESPVPMRRPYSVTALLELIETSQLCMTSRGKPEECVALATSTLKVTYWLLTVMYSFHESEQKLSEVDVKNFLLAQKLIKNFLDNDFTLGLIFIGKAEDKDTMDKLLALSHKFLDHPRLRGPDGNDILTEISAISARFVNLDPMHKLQGIQPQRSLVHAIQPMLLFEAVLRPGSDLASLTQHLHALAIMHNLTFVELVFEVIRSLLLSFSPKEGSESNKIDVFIMTNLPTLLEKLHKVMKKESGSVSGSSAPLKTPTDMYKVFEKILECGALLNSVDIRGKCNIITNLIKVVHSCQVQLMTDTEKDDVAKKRDAQVSKDMMDSMAHLSKTIGTTRNFNSTVRAEGSLKDLIKALESLDFSKSENVEKLLVLLSQIMPIESFDLMLGSASLNGMLRHFIKLIIKNNQNSQESQGESVKNSLTRMTLFDSTFLMLVYIVQSFGSEVVLAEAQGTFMSSWITDMMVESVCKVKPFQNVNINDNIVDNLLQQLINGDLRTQVVKWQNVCINIHQAVKEMITARTLNGLSEEDFKKMLTTLSSRLYAIPVCVVNFLASWKYSMPPNCPINIKQITSEFLDVVEKVSNEKLEQTAQKIQTNSADLSCTKERLELMMTIVNKIVARTGLLENRSLKLSVEKETFDPKSPLVLPPSFINRPLKDSLTDTWKSVGQQGSLDIEHVWMFQYLLKTGGPNWFTTCLVDDLLTVVYQAEINRKAELLLSIFSVDIEQCTLALLLHVIPGYLQNRNKRDRLTEPHGTALAKLTIGCIYIVLMGIQTQVSSKHSSQSRKRRADEMSDEVTSAKMLRFVGLANESAILSSVSTFASSYDDYISGLSGHTQTRQSGSPSDSANKVDDLSTHPVTLAVGGFFRLLHKVVTWQEIPITPCTHFTFRLLEQAALRGGRQPSSKSRLILQHMSTSLVMHVVKIVPHMFSMGLLCKLFDCSNPIGRKNLARVMCQLRNILESRKYRPLQNDQVQILQVVQQG